MNQDLFDQYFSKIVQSIDPLPLPLALVDNTLCLIWANPYLRQNLPYLTAPDSMTTLLKGYDIPSILTDLSASQLTHSYSCKLPFVATVLDFSPVFDAQEQLLGAIVHFSTATVELSSSNPQSADKVLSVFNMTLRSPLTSLFSTITTLSGRLDLEDFEACRLLLDQLNQNCYRLLKSCTSITEYARYCNALAFLRLKEVAFNTFLSDILNTARSILRTTGVDLTFDLPAHPVTLCCDPDKLVLVIMALLANSASFVDLEKGEQGRKVHLSTQITENRITVTVLDYGLGIPDEAQPHIFEPYFSYGKDTFTFSSIGLGLPLAKLIVAHHGGTIAVQSEEGKGTSVAFTLSRQLSLDDDANPFLANDSSVYIKNRFSPLYIFLSDLCECPEP